MALTIPDSWEIAMDALITALESHAEVFFDPTHGSSFDDDSDPSPSVFSPPQYVEYEEFSTQNNFDLSPVDYPIGFGEWSELDELPEHITEDGRRAVEEVSDESMRANDGSHELRSSLFRVNQDAGHQQPVNIGSSTTVRNRTDLDHPVTFLEEGLVQELEDLLNSSFSGTEAEPLNLDLIDWGSETGATFKSTMTDSGNECSIGPTDNVDENKTMVQTETSSPTAESLYSAVSVPVVLITDYDAEQTLLSHQPIYVHPDEREIIFDSTMEWTPEERTQINSLPELERLVGNCSQDPETLNAEEEISILLDHNTESYNLAPTDHIEAGETLIDRPNTPRLESRAGNYYLVPIENDHTGSSTSDEAEEHANFRLLYPEGEGLADQAILGSAQFSLPRWAPAMEVVPGYQAFTDGWGCEDFEFEEEELTSPTDHGPLGDQDDDDVPWDARPASIHSFETSSPCCLTPTSSIFAAPDVFGDLASVSGEVESVDYETMQDHGNDPEVYTDVGAFMEGVQTAAEREMVSNESLQNGGSYHDVYSAAAALMQTIRTAEEEDIGQVYCLGGPLLQ